MWQAEVMQCTCCCSVQPKHWWWSPCLSRPLWWSWAVALPALHLPQHGPCQRVRGVPAAKELAITTSYQFVVLICHSTSINNLHGAMICLYQLGTWLLSVTRGWWEEFSGGAVCVCRQIPGGCDHHFCLHSPWTVEAGPTHSHVLVHPTNNFHCSLRAKPFGEGCLAVAHHAHSLQLHHTLCTGHQLQNLTEWLKGDKQHSLGDNQ